ncbi:MAG: HAMP domain-containing histidine kinase [Bryobacterales bacterium]|nr:HAMP domain-containing histidine kinase [Bryobacterales bacterium]
MAPWTEWLKPPRTLLLSLFLLTLVSVSAVGWFGWRLLAQQRLVEAQRSQERLEQAAERMATTFRGALAEVGDRLGDWESGEKNALPVQDGIILQMKENGLAAFADKRLLYYPLPSSDPEASPAMFAEAEMFEFAQGQPRAALDTYERLAKSGDAAVRAGALLRIARVMRAGGRAGESHAVYGKLSAMSGVRVAGAPADLVARHELCVLSGGNGSRELRTDLLDGRWHLTRGQFAYYWAEAQRLTGDASDAPADRLAFSEAAEIIWDERVRNVAPRGQEALWTGGHALLVIWRGTPERRAVLVANPESFVRQVFANEADRYALVDAEGRVLAGEKSGSGRAVVLTAAESRLPWTIYVSSSKGTRGTTWAGQRSFLLLGISVMALFLILGTYFIGRAIRREAEVARMQSDFVAAVSHEFRSPLTTLRQLSEILSLGRVPSEDRRQLYYATLVKETTRLQRVVEALLNFGKMEAGARRYRFEELDAAQLVRRVVMEFEQETAASGRHIELHGQAAECLIDADPDALGVALRNLLDNALKYSPADSTVWVEWERAEERVAIKVRDEGLGIPEREKKAIFRKFVRGSAASTSNVKGSGIGLATVRHIVAAHGGEITLASKAGKGSTFTMLLPIVERT